MKVLSSIVAVASVFFWLSSLSYADPAAGEWDTHNVNLDYLPKAEKGTESGMFIALSKEGESPSAREVSRPIEADRPDFGPSGKKNFFTVFLGASYWKDVGDIRPLPSLVDPERYGQIKDWGYNFEGAYHRLVTKWFGHDVRFGVDLGFFYHENEKDYRVVVLPSGRTLDGEIVARGFYLTPSLRWVFGEKDSTRFFLGMGAGYYRVDFVEQLSDGTSSDTFFENDTIGAYLSAGMGFPLIRRRPESLMLRFEGKIHYADFGDLGEFAPGAGDLKGPICIFQVGLTF